MKTDHSTEQKLYKLLQQVKTMQTDIAAMHKAFDRFTLDTLEQQHGKAENELHKAIIEAEAKRFIHSTPGRDRLS